MKIKGLRFYMPDYTENSLVLTVENGRISSIERDTSCGSADLDLSGYIVAPAFVDVHIHGFKGRDISEGTRDALFAMSNALPETGTGAFLPTFVSKPANELTSDIKNLAPVLNDAKGALPIGFHLEGTFVNREMHGAMNPHYFVELSIETAKKLTETGSVRMFTVAPELKNAIEVIRFLNAKGISVSLGHTKTDFETAKTAFLNGATSVTHLFNAMPHFHHRNTGLLGAAFSLPFFLQFIGDGVHTSKEVLKIVHLVKDRLALITDCTEAGGMPEGRYMLGDYEIFTDGVSARLKDGTLAGSVLTMDQGVRNLVRIGGFSVEEAICSATEIPARSIGANFVGAIKTGNLANIVALDEELNVVLTIVKGRVVFDGRRN